MAPYEIPEFTLSAGDAGLALAVMVALTTYLGGLVVWYAVQSVGALRNESEAPGKFDSQAMAERFASRNARRRWRS